MNLELKYSLEYLEMLDNVEHGSGLIQVQEIGRIRELPPEEIIAIENALKYKADYIYFRRFEKRPSIAQVYLYDFTNETSINEEELTILHKQLYSSGHVPMFFVFTKKDVRIFNCFDRPAEGNRLIYKPLTTIKLASDLSKRLDAKSLEKFKAFSGKSFDNGVFWEDSEFSSEFKFSNGAYEKLLSELKQALKDIIDKEILPEHFARKIMVISILIKYLEEREDENNNRVFPQGFFNQFVDGAKKLTDILNQKGAYLQLLDYLAKHFNGGIFQLDDTERDFIKNKDLNRFGLFLDGKLDGIQFVFWKLYSFNDLPVELISNIYEEFLGKEPGVVYTPPYLVNFLLDEAMPLSNDNTDFKVMDPACGSGIFLVGIYRRLIYRWRSKNNWQKPSLSVLKKLLKENIFGVELKKDAADLTVFSLSLALCDELTPLQIWEDLKFDKLQGENIIHSDFFSVVANNALPKNFDLIIGNPPFEANLTPAAKQIELLKHRTRLIEFALGERNTPKNPIKLPDNQIALLFLEQSISFCKKGGLVCLIQPSGPLLYNNSSFNFRKHLLSKYFVPQIIDFTHISRILFGKNGDVATAAIFIKNEKAKESGLLHVTVRRTKPHKEKLFFELDAYDFHYIPRKVALSDSLIWKSNFLGGFRYHQLIQRLKSHPTLKEYIDSKENDGWVMSEGFTLATSRDKQKLRKLKQLNNTEEYYKLKAKLKADFLTGKKFLPTKALTINGINKNEIEDNLVDELFHSKGNPFIYKAPQLLIKEVIVDDQFPIALSTEDLTFQRRIVGIHAPEEEKGELEMLLKRISNNHIYPFYIAATSGQYLVNKSSAIYKQDIDKLPYPKNAEDLELTYFENILINDFNDYLLEFRRNGENSKIATVNASEADLNKFGKIFCQILSPVFKTLNPYKFFETDSFICFPFYFGEKPEIEFNNSSQSEKHFENLIKKTNGSSLSLTRIIRLYEGNIIYLIKPKKLRFWLQSIALRDADETFADLRKQGY